MIGRLLKLTLPVLALALLVAIAPAALALGTVNYGDFVGTNVTFEDVSETSTFGDPEPLFGAPLVLGNQLLFFPANFSANAAGAGGFDQTGAQLQTSITANGPLDIIDTLMVSEFGDTDLAGVGTAATGTFIGLSGFVTVLETTSGLIAPVVIPFVGTFSQDTFTLPGDPGTTVFSGGFSVDIASVVPNATWVVLSMDNDLFAFSEAGSAVSIQKKVVSGPAIVVDVVPEPGTALLVGLGLLGLGARGRTRKA